MQGNVYSTLLNMHLKLVEMSLTVFLSGRLFLSWYGDKARPIRRESSPCFGVVRIPRGDIRGVGGERGWE